MRLDFGDFGRVDTVQVRVEFLDVFESAKMVHGFDAPVGGPNEHQLEPEPVLSAHDFLFFFVVVRGRAQMSENHFGNPDLVFGMFRHVNAIAVIRHGDGSVFGNGGFDIGNRFSMFGGGLEHSNDMVAAIHNTLIE